MYISTTQCSQRRSKIGKSITFAHKSYFVRRLNFFLMNLLTFSYSTLNLEYYLSSIIIVLDLIVCSSIDQNIIKIKRYLSNHKNITCISLDIEYYFMYIFIYIRFIKTDIGKIVKLIFQLYFFQLFISAHINWSSMF